MTSGLLDGAEAEHAAELIDRQHPVRLSHHLLGYTTRHFELTPLGKVTAASSLCHRSEELSERESARAVSRD